MAHCVWGNNPLKKDRIVHTYFFTKKRAKTKRQRIKEIKRRHKEEAEMRLRLGTPSKKQRKEIEKRRSQAITSFVEAEIVAFERREINELDINDQNVINYYKYLKYPGYLNTRYWEKVKESVHYYKKCCEDCGSTERLQVHHLNYRIKGKELLGDNINKLKLLCRKCHISVHGGVEAIKNKKSKNNKNKGGYKPGVQSNEVATTSYRPPWFDSVNRPVVLKYT